MNLFIQHSKPNRVFQPSCDASQGDPPRSAFHASGRFASAGLLLGLVLLLLGAPPAHADRNPPGCTGSGLGISLFTSLPDVHIGDTISYSVSVFNAPFPSCNAGETNPAVAGAITAFVVTPDGVTNYLTLRRTFLAPGDGDFYTNVVSYVVRAQDVRSDGTVRATAVDEGDIHQNDVNSHGGGNQGVNTQVNLPCVLIAAQCVGSVGENGAITFTGTVTNCGNNTLVGVTVTNFYDSGFFTVLFPTNLAFGQVASFSGSWVPANPCLPSTAVLTVRATDQFTSTPRTVTNFTTITCQSSLTPGIKVTKACPAQPVAPGQLLTFSGSVSNIGNVTLTNIVVVNNQPVANTRVFSLASLAPGALANFTASYVAPANCSVSDTLIASAQSRCGDTVTSTVSATCPIATAPLLALTQNCPVTPVSPGGLLTYSGSVSNAGNITLTNVVVLNNLSGATPIFKAATLAPSAVASFTGSYLAPTNCSTTSTSSATAQSICGIAVTNTVISTCPIATTPLLALTQNCPATHVSPGTLLTYSGSVSNAGNVLLTNVVVLNDQSGATPVFTAATLAPKAVASFTGSYLAPTNCSTTSTSTATAQSLCGVAVTNTVISTCPLVTTPSIAVTQICPQSPPSPGGLLTYSGTVENSGNITLTNVVVFNNLSGATPVFTTATLAPGAVATFTGSYVAPTNCSSTSTSIATGRSICGIAVTNSASATCPIATTPLLALTQNCPAVPVSPGGLLTYSGSVSNAGNIMLTNVVVLNNLSGATPIFKAATLAPSAVASFSGSYLAPTNCSTTSTSTATGQSICGIAVTNAVISTCPIATTPLLALTQNCPVTPVTPGGLLTYSGSISNAGNIMLTNVVVLNDQSGATPVFTAATLAPKAFASFTGSYLAPTNCSTTSTSTATGQSLCGVVVTTTMSSTCPVATTPSIAVTQICPPTPPSPGSPLTYSGTVINSGNITLTNVVVLNNLSGTTPVFTASTLAPGAVASFTGSYVTPTNCSTTSASTATGQSVCGVPVSNTATMTCPIATTPMIAVTAICPSGPVVPGGSVTYSGTVHNPGIIPLTNVVVVSSRPAASTTVFTAATLAPGASTNFTGTYTVPSNACSVTTAFSATGMDACSLTSVTNTVSTTCTVTTTPQIAVTLACPAVPAAPGGAITYSGSVSNSGDVTLNNVFVVNNHPASNTPVIGPLTLAPGASANFTTAFTAPLDACSVSTTVMATGSDNCTALQVANSAAATCPLITTPGIVLTQLCPTTPAVPGGVLTYSGTVRNSGDITLTNVVVVNNMSGATPVFTTSMLAPGAVTNFTGSYLAPTNCSTTSISIATGESVCGVAVTNTASATCPILTAPAIAVTQACPPTPVVQGGLLTYSGTVSNAGNITLTNIVVVNNWPVHNVVVLTLPSLAPGAMANFTGSYVVPANCCVAWSTVQASGQGCDGVTVTDTDSGTCTVSTSPGILVTKVCGPGLPKPGDLMTYSGIVSNTGNITLFNVTVVNNQPTVGSLLLGPITLAPGEFSPYTASYVVPVDFCGGDTVTATGLDVCGYTPAVSSVTTTCPVAHSPGIAVSNHCPPQPTAHSGQLIFSGTVTNTGNVTLVNVFVVNDQPTNNTPVIGPITLAPGASYSFTGSYTAPPVCCEMIHTLTASGQDRCSASNVTATATAVCPMLYTPGIALVQSCPANPLPMGSMYVFSGFVTNTGDAILTNVMVFSGPPGQTVTWLGPLDLAPGQAEEYSGSLTVASNLCAVSVSVTSQEVCKGTWITNATACPVATTPLLAVTQNCPATEVSQGAVLTYSGTVSNAGNITLTNIVVLNDQSGATPILTTAALAPGAVMSFTGSYLAPATGTATSTSTATGASLCGDGVTNSASATCLILSTPHVAVRLLTGNNTVLGLSFPTDQGKSYTVEYKNALSDSAWTDLQTIVGTGGALTITNQLAPQQPTRFYRIRYAQ
jgi:uncharacterized repeat protein (TIGR01451 family)